MYRLAFRILGLVGEAAVTAMAGVALFTTSVYAGEQPLAGRYINLTGQPNCAKVEDVEGHIICSYDVPSVGIRDNGEMYSRITKGTLNWVKGVGPIQGYTVSTYADGSTMATQWKGTSKLNDEKLSTMEGTLTCVGGTGRFAGVKCNGTWTGTRVKGGYTQGNYKGTLTLPD